MNPFPWNVGTETDFESLALIKISCFFLKTHSQWTEPVLLIELWFHWSKFFFVLFHLCCVFSHTMLILGWVWCSIVWRQEAFKNFPNFVLLSHQRNIVHHNQFMDNWTFTISANMSCLLSSMFLVSKKVYAAAAAKSLQSCPTLCDPIDGSPPGSSIPGILQARILKWVAISFSNAWKWKVKVTSLSRVQLFVTPWTAAHQAPLSMGFSMQEYWSGLPLPSPQKGYGHHEKLSHFYI